MEHEKTISQSTIELKGKRGKAHRPKSSSHSNRSLSLSTERDKTLSLPYSDHYNSQPADGKEEDVDTMHIEDDTAAEGVRKTLEEEDVKLARTRNATWCNESVSSGSNVSLGLQLGSSPEGSNASLGGSFPVSNDNKVPTLWKKLKGMLTGRSSSVGSSLGSDSKPTTPSLTPNGTKTPEELFHKHSSRSLDSREFNEDAAARRRRIIGDMVKNTDNLAEKQYEEMKMKREKERQEQEERQRKLIEMKKLQAAKGILDGTEHERRMYALQYYFDQDKKHQGFLMTSFCKLLLQHPKTRPLLKQYVQQQKANLGLTSTMERGEVVKVIAQKWMKETRRDSPDDVANLNRELEQRRRRKVTESVISGSDNMDTSSSGEKDTVSNIQVVKETLKRNKSETTSGPTSPVKSESELDSAVNTFLEESKSETRGDNSNTNLQTHEGDTGKEKNLLKKKRARSAAQKLLLEQKVKARLNKQLRRNKSTTVISEIQGDTQAKVARYPRSEEMLHDLEDATQGTITKPGSIEDKNLAKYVKSLEDAVDEKLKTILIDEATGGNQDVTSGGNGTGKLNDKGQTDCLLV